MRGVVNLKSKPILLVLLLFIIFGFGSFLVTVVRYNPPLCGPVIPGMYAEDGPIDLLLSVIVRLGPVATLRDWAVGVGLREPMPIRTGGLCPVCLAGNSMIATPRGQVVVKDVKLGMSVWTIDKQGNRVSGIVIKTSRIAVPQNHEMIRLVLDDGRDLFVSFSHPTINGNLVGNLRVGDYYAGSVVKSVESVSYSEGSTYDILPSGDTGFYYANGIPVGSTIKE